MLLLIVAGVITVDNGSLAGLGGMVATLLAIGTYWNNRAGSRNADARDEKREGRVKDDYIVALRRQVSDLGADPLPWPTELRDD